MFKLLAGAFASIGVLFGGLFGGHHPMPMASTTPMHQMSSSTPWMNDHMGSTTPWGNGSTTPGHMGMMPGIFGKVVSIDGDTITVTGHGGPNTATTTYTVDATNAKIIKGGKPTSSSSNTITISDIQTNDTVMVNGTITGTDVTAKAVIDGVMMPMMMGGHSMPMPPDQGNQNSSGGSW